MRFVAFTNPEDAAVFKRPAQVAERPEVARGAVVWANDLENIPVFFALCGLAIALGTAEGPNAGLSIVFTLAGSCTHGPIWQRCSPGVPCFMASGSFACWVFA